MSWHNDFSFGYVRSNILLVSDAAKDEHSFSEVKVWLHFIIMDEERMRWKLLSY